MSFLEWREVTREFSGLRALDGLCLSVEEGEILGVLGPSGSGKSTLLRITAGLETATSGRILLKSCDLTDVPPHRRGVGLMFQEYCLFPHLNVQANVGFGLRKKGWSRDRRMDRVEKMLRLVRLHGFGRRDVLTLSGGEQQRVALARSLAPEPALLMLDEPLGALDSLLKTRLLGELMEILREVGLTVIYVTHDAEEAMIVAGRIAVMNAGRILQLGTPEELVRSPASAFVASFLGLGALLPGTRARREGMWVLDTEIGVFPAYAENGPFTDAAPLQTWKLLVRPGAVSFLSRPGSVEARARVIAYLQKPAGTAIRLALEGRKGVLAELECVLSGSENTGIQRSQGKTAAVWIDPARCLALTD
jgi:thiamine transport system ATP-binding protein